jgi:hypothetical protein
VIFLDVGLVLLVQLMEVCLASTEFAKLQKRLKGVLALLSQTAQLQL